MLMRHESQIEGIHHERAEYFATMPSIVASTICSSGETPPALTIPVDKDWLSYCMVPTHKNETVMEDPSCFREGHA